MPIGLAYQVIKDLIALAKMEEGDAIDPGTLDAKELAVMGIIDAENADECSWAKPNKVFARVQASDATHDLVWVTDNTSRTKHQVVRYTHDGTLDLVLLRRKGADT